MYTEPVLSVVAAEHGRSVAIEYVGRCWPVVLDFEVPFTITAWKGQIKVLQGSAVEVAFRSDVDEDERFPNPAGQKLSNTGRSQTEWA